MNDPRVEAGSKALYSRHEDEADAQNAMYVGLPVDEFGCCTESVLAAADAVDREQGIHRVRVDDATVERVARIIAANHSTTTANLNGQMKIARAVLAALTGAKP